MFTKISAHVILRETATVVPGKLVNIEIRMYLLHDNRMYF